MFNRFNLETREWEVKATAPYITGLTNQANAMWAFRGKPTIFGQGRCDEDDSNCANDDIVQYRPDRNEWINVGRMMHPRALHEVIFYTSFYM